jgi:hypothetical protein
MFVQIRGGVDLQGEYLKKYTTNIVQNLTDDRENVSTCVWFIILKHFAFKELKIIFFDQVDLCTIVYNVVTLFNHIFNILDHKTFDSYMKLSWMTIAVSVRNN